MDLLSEASSGARVLTARHINAEKALLAEENEAVNTTLSCYSYSLQPDIGSYIAALHSYVWVLWPCALLLLLATWAMYAVNMRSAQRHWRDCVTSASVVLAVYPVVSTAGFIAVVVPRARIISEAIAQQAVMIAMYHLYCMIIAETGGSDKFVRRAGESRLETRVLPCCCWPCCVIPRPKFDKRSLSWLRYLVLQMAVIQGILYTIILVLWAEDMMLYLRSFIYIQPFVVASILSGVWGIIMTVRAAESVGLSPRPRFLALQLVLLIVKLQCALAKVLSEFSTLPCIVSLHPAVVVHMTQNGIMMLEMLVLSLWAWRLYRVSPGKTPDNVRQVVVAVLENSLNSNGAGIKDSCDRSIDNNGDI